MCAPPPKRRRGAAAGAKGAVHDLGIDWSVVETVFDLHTALRRALERARVS